LDRGAGTLTAMTNRFSIWAVMVAQGQISYETTGGAAQPTKADGFTALIACGALGLLLIASRVRKR
jgi:hypothetical protein